VIKVNREKERKKERERERERERGANLFFEKMCLCVSVLIYSCFFVFLKKKIDVFYGICVHRDEILDDLPSFIPQPQNSSKNE